MVQEQISLIWLHHGGLQKMASIQFKLTGHIASCWEEELRIQKEKNFMARHTIDRGTVSKNEIVVAVLIA